MTNFRHVLLCLIILWSTPVGAQPLVETEHDWRFSVGGKSYGLVQHVVIPGDYRMTKIYFGSEAYTTSLLAIEVLGLALLPFGILSVVILFQQRRVQSD